MYMTEYPLITIEKSLGNGYPRCTCRRLVHEQIRATIGNNDCSVRVTTNLLLRQQSYDAGAIVVDHGTKRRGMLPHDS